MSGRCLCVDLAFFLIWFKYPCAVFTYFVKYLRTSLDVNPGHDWRETLSMAPILMDCTGMKAVSCKYYISSCSDNFWYTFFSVLHVVLLVTHWNGKWAGFSIIHLFWILVLGWIFYCCLLLCLAVIWTQMFIHKHIYCKLNKWYVCKD